MTTPTPREPVEVPVFPDRQDIVFHGHWQPTGGALINIETRAGEVLGLLHHHVKHSPDGFQWGYEGSGPAETARCLLLAALPDPRCVYCAGTTKVVLAGDGSKGNDFREVPFDPDRDDPDDPDGELVFGCQVCDGDGFAPVPYQQFKRAIVAGWVDGDWRMSREEILAWLNNYRETTK